MENKEVLNNKFLERDYAHAYASFGLRAFAFIVDMLVIGAINKILINVLGIDLDYEIYGIEMAEIFRWIVTILYFVIISLVTKGQTLGKMIAGIRVVSLTSDKLDLGQILIRETAGRLIQNTIMILYLLPIFTPKNQSLIDFFVDTAVVKDDAFIDLYGVDFR